MCLCERESERERERERELPGRHNSSFWFILEHRLALVRGELEPPPTVPPPTHRSHTRLRRVFALRRHRRRSARNGGERSKVKSFRVGYTHARRPAPPPPPATAFGLSRRFAADARDRSLPGSGSRGRHSLLPESGPSSSRETETGRKKERGRRGRGLACHWVRAPVGGPLHACSLQAVRPPDPPAGGSDSAGEIGPRIEPARRRRGPWMKSELGWISLPRPEGSPESAA